MSKFGKQHDQQRRRATAGALAQLSEGTWEAPAADDCDRYDEIPCPLTTTTRLFLHLRYRSGRLVFFAIMHEALRDGTWVCVSKIDCMHKEVHQHFYGLTHEGEVSRIRIAPLHSEQDVDANYQASYNLIADNWEENERKWQNA